MLSFPWPLGEFLDHSANDQVNKQVLGQRFCLLVNNSLFISLSILRDLPHPNNPRPLCRGSSPNFMCCNVPMEMFLLRPLCRGSSPNFMCSHVPMKIFLLRPLCRESSPNFMCSHVPMEIFLLGPLCRGSSPNFMCSHVPKPPCSFLMSLFGLPKNVV